MSAPAEAHGDHGHEAPKVEESPKKLGWFASIVHGARKAVADALKGIVDIGKDIWKYVAGSGFVKEIHGEIKAAGKDAIDYVGTLLRSPSANGNAVHGDAGHAEEKTDHGHAAPAAHPPAAPAHAHA